MRELSIGEKQDILILRKYGKSIRAIAKIGLIQHNLKCPEKKETTGVLSNCHWTCRSRGKIAVDDRNLVRAVMKNTNQHSVTSARASTVQRWSFHNPTFEKSLQEQKYRGQTTRCKPLISSKNRQARKYKDERQNFCEERFWDWLNHY